MSTLTRTADFANAAFLNELETIWHDEPLAFDPGALSGLADPPASRRASAIREPFAPLDSYSITAPRPLRNREEAAFLRVAQAG